MCELGDWIWNNPKTDCNLESKHHVRRKWGSRMILIGQMARFRKTQQQERSALLSQSLGALITNEYWSVLVLLLWNTEPVPLGLTLSVRQAGEMCPFFSSPVRVCQAGCFGLQKNSKYNASPLPPRPCHQNSYPLVISQYRYRCERTL